MAFLKAPILFLVFCFLMILPESSFAQQCSAQRGALHGCRSGIACSFPNKRTGELLWECKDGPPASASAPPPTSSDTGGARSPSVKKSVSQQPKVQPAAPMSDADVAAENQRIINRTPVQDEPAAATEPSSSEGLSTGNLTSRSNTRGDCSLGYYAVSAANSSFVVPELGDAQERSTTDGVLFCRKDGVTADDAAEAIAKRGSQNISEDCKNFKGNEFVKNGTRFCRYMASGGEYSGPMVCQINASGEMHTCNKEDSGNVADGGDCETQFNQVKQACFIQAEKASTDCSQENDGIQQAMNATKAVGAGSAVSMKMACSKLGEISKIANVSLTGWQSFCAFTQNNCETECSRAKALYEKQGCISEETKNGSGYAAEYKTIKENVAECISYKKRIAEAAQHATAALVQLQAAKKCEEDTGNGLTVANVDECKKNPNNPLCTDAQRCSNTEFAASNKVCQCINNPNSKDCVAATAAAGSRDIAGGATLPGVGGGSTTDPAAAFVPPTSSGENPFATDLKNGAKTNELNLGGAKGNAGMTGGGGSSGSGGLGSNSYGGSGPGADGDKSKINSGFYGGGTGATGGYFGKTSGATGSGGRLNAGGVNYNKMAGGAQFDPRRYIAGLNGKGGEYINGPNMDIFRIVKNRIEAKKPSMLDPDFKK